jgi:inorganic pyrophosphatase
LRGDGDPLDICVLSFRSINRAEVLLSAVPIGGFRLIERNEADDKIIAIVKDDGVMGAWKDISDMPPALLELFEHYFLTYKLSPADMGGAHNSLMTMPQVYGREQAFKVIAAAKLDYHDKYGDQMQQFEAQLLETITEIADVKRVS